MNETVILIPAYHPDGALIRSLTELKAEGLTTVVVNDGSGSKYDEVFEEARKYAVVIGYPENQGKGFALKTGIAYIENNMPDAEIIVTADADGQHKTKDILAVAEEAKKCDGLVLGGRKFVGKVPFRSRAGNAITRFVFRISTGKKVHDTQTGLRAFKRPLFALMREIKGNRYEYEMAVLMVACEKKIPIVEHPIETVYENDNKSSHFNAVKDSFRIYKVIFHYATGLRFLLSSLFAFLINYALLLIFNKIFTFKFGTETALIGAWIVSSLSNFLVNRNWVFRSKDKPMRDLWQYYTLALPVFVVKNFGFIEMFYRLLHLPLWLAAPIAEVVLFILNYIIQKKLIFRKKPSDEKK